MSVDLLLFTPTAWNNKTMQKLIEDEFEHGMTEMHLVDNEKAEWLDMNTTAFTLHITYGHDEKSSLLFSVGLDDLEMFAYGIQKTIEMYRRDNADLIKQKRDEGHIF